MHTLAHTLAQAAYRLLRQPHLTRIGPLAPALPPLTDRAGATVGRAASAAARKFSLGLAACAFGLLLASAVQAAPVWVWLDENGRRVASDRPPPATVPDQRILRRPATPAAAPTAGASAAPAATAPTPRPAPTAGTPAGSLTDAQLRQQVEQRNAQIRADNCQRARASLDALQAGPGQPLYMVNEQGQRVTMDEAMKRAETVRLRQIVRDNCAPPAANPGGASAPTAPAVNAPTAPTSPLGPDTPWRP